MHKRTIHLAISAIMLALVVSVPVDAAGQGRAGLRQRQQQQRERSPRDSDRRARPAPRRAVPRARSDRRGYDQRQRGYDQRQRGYDQRGYGQRGGFFSRFNFNFQLGTSQYGYVPQYYPPYNSYDYYPGCRVRYVYGLGGRLVRSYVCLERMGY